MEDKYIMNSKGQVIMVGLMLTVAIIVLALAIAPALKENADNIMNTTNELGEASALDCNNASISDYDKGACAIVDITTPYFIGGLIALALAIMGAKLILENA